MKLFVFALAASASLSTAAELEFSHRVHLDRVGLTCGGCHSSTKTSRNAADDNLPGPQICAACHNGEVARVVDVGPLRERAPAERGFFFNHELHLAIGNVAPAIAAAIDEGRYLGIVPDIREHLETENPCVACHRGLAVADEVDSKVHLPRMSDCLTCHDHIDNPFSCEKCHPPEFPIRPADHTRDFVDLHSTGRMQMDKRTCQPCHGRTFTCMGCH